MASPDIGRATATMCFGIADTPPTIAKETTWRHAGRDGRQAFYAGFPAAITASAIANEALRQTESEPWLSSAAQ
jgi:hypothetical protein